jgi:hypothetical protein
MLLLNGYYLTDIMGWINTFKRQIRDREAALHDRRIYPFRSQNHKNLSQTFPIID